VLRMSTMEERTGSVVMLRAGSEVPDDQVRS
jgi:hypothetical protein